MHSHIYTRTRINFHHRRNERREIDKGSRMSCVTAKQRVFQAACNYCTHACALMYCHESLIQTGISSNQFKLRYECVWFVYCRLRIEWILPERLT